MDNKNDMDKFNKFQPKLGEIICYLIAILIAVVFRLLKLSSWYSLVLLPVILGIRLYYTHFYKKDKNKK